MKKKHWTIKDKVQFSIQSQETDIADCIREAPWES